MKGRPSGVPFLLVTLLALLVLAGPLDAQRAATVPGPRLGAHAGYNLDLEDWLVGAQLVWPFSPRAAFYPSFDYYFVDQGSLWSLNFDLRLTPPSRYGVLYLGGGLNYSRTGDSGRNSDDSSINLLIGLEGRRSRSAPYVEGRFIVGDGSAFQIVGGFAFR